MEASVAAEAQAPERGDYYHDGSRLVEVVVLRNEEWVLVEDIQTGLTLELPVNELMSPGVWKLVRHALV